MLAGGDPCACAVKYEGDGKILRTPLIITSNHRVFNESDPVWTSRIYFEEWSACNMLKNLDYYPHPLTWYKLLTTFC